MSLGRSVGVSQGGTTVCAVETIDPGLLCESCNAMLMDRKVGTEGGSSNSCENWATSALTQWSRDIRRGASCMGCCMVARNGLL